MNSGTITDPKKVATVLATSSTSAVSPAKKSPVPLVLESPT